MRINDLLFHRFLRFPYLLHATVRSAGHRHKSPTLIFLHGLGDSGAAWNEVIKELPSHYRIVVIDLLGFGKSPKPKWATYNVALQVHSIVATCLWCGIYGKTMIVGHSLGALVAVEYAKRYPFLTQALILCSPPLYHIDEETKRLLPSSDAVLREMYRLAKKNPEQFLRLSALAARLGLTNKSFHLTTEGTDVYMNALEASIINQTSLSDALSLHVPTIILYGKFDPIVVPKNFRMIAKRNPHITVMSVLSAHELRGLFIPAVLRAISDLVAFKK